MHVAEDGGRCLDRLLLQVNRVPLALRECSPSIDALPNALKAPPNRIRESGINKLAKEVETGAESKTVAS